MLRNKVIGKLRDDISYVYEERVHYKLVARETQKETVWRQRGKETQSRITKMDKLLVLLLGSDPAKPNVIIPALRRETHIGKSLMHVGVMPGCAWLTHEVTNNGAPLPVMTACVSLTGRCQGKERGGVEKKESAESGDALCTTHISFAARVPRDSCKSSSWRCAAWDREDVW